jgi:hypothetical protein
LFLGSVSAVEIDFKSARGKARFEEMSWLVGEWQGWGKFPNRVTYIQKQFGFEVGGVFLFERMLDMFPPTEPSTEFEMQQDLSLFYWDTVTSTLRAKGFFVEGFVTSSDVKVEQGGAVIIIENREVENGSKGMRTRYSIKRSDADHFTATFEIAMPGAEYRTIEELQMSRVM